LKHYYHNGTQNRKFDPEVDVIPEGFEPGRYMDPEVDRVRREKLSKRAQEQWNDSEKRKKLIDAHNTKEYKDKMHVILTSQPGFQIYNNGIAEIHVKENEIPPEGFVHGRLPLSEESRLKLKDAAKKRKSKNTTGGKIAINKDDQEKYILPEELNMYIEMGWVRGGKPKRDLRDYSHVWNKGLTKETDERMKLISEKVREYNLQMSQETKDKISKTMRELWQDPTYREQAIKRLYGRVPWNKGLVGVIQQTEKSNQLRSDSIHKTILEQYGTVENFSKHISKQSKLNWELHRDEIIAKRNKTIIEKYGTFENYYKILNEKIDKAHRKNNSFNTSKEEIYYYELLKQQFGENNIIKQYKDNRYPFRCDFYVISEDLFIEINYHWTHGLMPFDINNPEHLIILDELQEKSKVSKYYEQAIYVWTDLDVRKLQCAIDNNLHYWRYYSDGSFYKIN
jgi:hypothetical protein